MPLPVSGQTLTGAYVYLLLINVNVGTLLGVDAVDLLSSPNGGAGTDVIFGTDTTTVPPSETVTYTNSAGTQVTQYINTSDDSQSPSAFTYTADGATYVVSNGPITPANLLDITVGSLTALIGGLGDINLVAGANSYVACYAAGTLITTPTGKVAVDALAIGDLVTTASGEARPVRWLGRRSYAGRFLRARPELLPVLFRAGSLGHGLPSRDLRVSPRHAMLLDGLLVPAEALVNGDTIVVDVRAERIDYIHVELERHDVILAEDAASETFVDDDSRMMFHNALEYRALYPDATPVPALYCAPRVSEGWELERIRAALPRGADQDRTQDQPRARAA